MIDHSAHIFELMATCGSTEALRAALVWLETSGCAQSHHCLGLVHAKMGHFREALGYFEKACHLEPDNAAFHSNLGNTHKRLKHLDSALVHYLQALKLEPRVPTHYNNLGNIKFLQKQWRDAQDYFQQALRLQADYLDAHFNLAQTYMALDAWDSARPHYLKVIDLKPTHISALTHLGLIYTQAGLWDEAYPHLHRACQLDDSKADTWYQLANVCLELGYGDQATEAYSKTLSLDPHYSEAHHNLAILELNARNSAKALFHFERSYELDANNFTAHHLIQALKGLPSDSVNPKYIKDLFDQYAPHYAQHMTSKLHYHAPFQVRSLLGQHLSLHHGIRSVLDLGCGTGLAGAQFRDIAAHLTGVDISPAMIELAQQTRLYDKLVCDEIFHFLDITDQRYDLILAIDVLSYLGRLEAFTLALKQRQAPGGFVALTIELEERFDVDYQLQTTGRFAHNSTYLKGLLELHGFAILADEVIVLRQQDGQAVRGLVLIATKVNSERL